MSDENKIVAADDAKLAEEAESTSMSLEAITEGKNERGIPAVKFLDDIGAFANQFTPPASPELLIGAYSDIFSKYKTYEKSLAQKSATFQEKIPEIEKSLALVTNLKKKQEQEEAVVTRYSFADAVYGKAEVDTEAGIVALWLGANVMLEYTYDEAIELLSSKEEKAKRDYKDVTKDLEFTRNQIITAEVNISRIYNWDVRRRREAKPDNAGN